MTAFFDSFDEWVTEIDAVEFASETESDGKRSDDAVELVTTFVYIQMLDEYGVVDDDWIRTTWERHVGDGDDERTRTTAEEETQTTDDETTKRAVLDAFFADVDECLESHYGAGIFARNVTASLDPSESNVTTLFQRLGKVLGFESTGNDAFPGITNYDYADIDEDVFGRIYERYLADGREGRGIYYTPAYVSQSVVADTVGTEIRRLADRIRDAVEDESWDDAATAATAFTRFRLLDPACGTGSFLVAAYDTIRDEYDRLFDFLAAERRARDHSRTESDDDARGRLEALQKTLGYTDDHESPHLRERAVVVRLVLRHLHAIDLDDRALAIAKLNIWLRAVRRDTHWYDDSSGESCVFHALDANFGCGDALVGLSDERVRKRLHERYGDEMETVLRARAQSLDTPDDPTPLERASELTSKIRTDLDATFESFLDANELPSAVFEETTPFYWPLQFWHVLGDGGGFDCVVGNPPWVIEGKEHTKRFLAETYDHQAGQPDLYRYFLERSFAATTGRLGMVTPNTWLSIPGAQQLRRVLLGTARLEKIAFVPDAAFTGVGQNSIAVVVDRHASPTGGSAGDDENALIRVGDIDTSGGFREARTIRSAHVEPPSYHVNPYVGSAETMIIDAMGPDAPELREIADLTVGYQLYHRSLHTDEQIRDEVFHSETNAGADYVADTRSDALTRYHLDSSKRQYVDSSAEFFRIPPRRFLDGEKLLVREVPSKAQTGLIAARSEDTLLFPKSVISVVLTDDDYDCEHLLGLLNSRLLYLASLVTGEKMGQDLFPRVSLTQLRELPIEGTTELTSLVRKLERLAAGRVRFRRIWNRHTQTPETETRSLAQILAGDDDATRGEDGESWTVACSFASKHDDDVLERAYPSFEFVADADEPTLVLSGVDAGVASELLRVEFENRELLQAVYLSLTTLFESRAKVDHLGHVLEKTAVPVGDAGDGDTGGVGGAVDTRRGVEYAVDTMREVQRVFTSERDERTAGGGDDDGQIAMDSTSADVVRIDDALATCQMELDAAVFGLYGLTPDEARAVLSVLDIRETVVEATVSNVAASQAVDES